MFFQIGASALLAAVAIYAFTQLRTARLLGFSTIALIVVGEYFVLRPNDATLIAESIGIGRGADLVFYLWILLSLVAFLNLHLQLRRSSERFVSLSRAIALTNANPTAAAPTYVVIPAYNEEPVVADVIANVKNVCSDVIGVDDGSSDATAERAQAAGAHVVRHPVNLGQGAALQTGISFALARGAGYIVTFDADGQHEPTDINRLLEALKTCSAVALGSRFKGQVENMPATRRAMLKTATMANWVLTGLNLSDAHNGIRAFTRDAASQIRIWQPGMAHATEIVAEVARHKLKYVEVPVTIRYTEYSLAKGQKLSNSVHILLDLFLRKLSSR